MKTIKLLLMSFCSLMLLSVFTLSLVSCGDDDDDTKTNLSIRQQWLMDDFEKVWDGYDHVSFREEYDAMCYDFSKPTTLVIFTRIKKVYKWIQFEALYPYEIVEETANTGYVNYSGKKLFDYEIDININEHHTKKPILKLKYLNKHIATFHPTTGVHTEGDAPV